MGKTQNYDESSLTVIEEWQKYLVLGAIGTTFVGIISLTSPFIYMQLKSPLPYMSTPRSKILAALNHISKLKMEQQQQRLSKISNNNLNPKNETKMTKVFYDIGSGDGEAVLAAASAGWHSIGIEMNPTLYIISQIRRLFFSKSDVRKRCKFILGDMFTHNIQSSDAVMIFGVKPLMPRIANKIKKECLPGTYVLSYRFNLPTASKEGKNNDDDEFSKNKAELNATNVFDEEEMRIWIVDGDER